MRYFDPVVVVADPGTLELGLALRASLEAFRLRVDFHHCVQRRRLLEVLAGDVAPAGYVVLCAGGWHAPEPESLNFARMVDIVDNQWQEVGLRLTPDLVGEKVRLPGRTVLVMGGCNAAAAGLATAFLDAGCTHYIAAESTVDADAVLLFAIGFFYQLMQEERDPAVACTIDEAVTRAAAADSLSHYGTHRYRLFSNP